MLDSGCIVARHARLGGGCRIGVGAIVGEGVAVGSGAIVSMGAVVYADVDPGATVVGNPAVAVQGAASLQFPRKSA